jgi:uncharacterized protein YoxC
MLQTISVTVIAASIVIFIIFLIPVLLQVRRTAREAEKTLETVRTQIVPLSHDLTVISLEIKGIVQSIHRQVEKVEDGISTVGDAALRLREFEGKIERVVEAPLLELVALFTGLIRGVEAFLRFFRR